MAYDYDTELSIRDSAEAINLEADLLAAAWDADETRYAFGHLDHLYRMVREMYTLTGRTPPED